MRWRGAYHGITGGATTGVGPPWGSIEGLFTPCVLFFSDAVLMGCERQYDKVDGLEVDFRDCGRKDAAAAAKVIIFEAEQGTL